jgi:predicted amidohydrolase
MARVAACTIVSTVADPTANAAAILDAAKASHEKSVAVAVFPELCLSGYAAQITLRLHFYMHLQIALAIEADDP